MRRSREGDWETGNHDEVTWIKKICLLSEAKQSREQKLLGGGGAVEECLLGMHKVLGLNTDFLR